MLQRILASQKNAIPRYLPDAQNRLKWLISPVVASLLSKKFFEKIGKWNGEIFFYFEVWIFVVKLNVSA
jgi:hypothetical protein